MSRTREEILADVRKCAEEDRLAQEALDAAWNELVRQLLAPYVDGFNAAREALRPFTGASMQRLEREWKEAGYAAEGR